MRKETATMNNTRGTVEKKISSKRSVKSNPPRQSGPAQGPNEWSTEAQFEVGVDAIETVEKMPSLLQNVSLDAGERAGEEP